MHFTPKQDSYFRQLVQGRAMEAAFGNEWSRQRVTTPGLSTGSSSIRRGDSDSRDKEVWVAPASAPDGARPAAERRR